MKIIQMMFVGLLVLLLSNTIWANEIDKNIAIDARLELSNVLYEKSVEADRGRNSSLAIRFLTIANILDPNNEIYTKKIAFLGRFLKQSLEAKYYQALYDFNIGRVTRAKTIVSKAVLQNSMIYDDYEKKFFDLLENISASEKVK